MNQERKAKTQPVGLKRFGQQHAAKSVDQPQYAPIEEINYALSRFTFLPERLNWLPRK
jgi:hypothetical protein